MRNDLDIRNDDTIDAVIAYRGGRMIAGAFYSTGDQLWHVADSSGTVARVPDRDTAAAHLRAITR